MCIRDSGDTLRGQTDTYAHGMYYRDDDYTVVDRVVAVAERHGVKPAQVALAWLLNKPGVVAPIIGASKMYQLEEAVAAVEVKLSAEDHAYLEEVYQPHPVLGH